MLRVLGSVGVRSWRGVTALPLQQMRWRGTIEEAEEEGLDQEARRLALFEEFGVTEYLAEEPYDYNLGLGDDITEKTVFKGVMETVAKTTSTTDAAGWRTVTRRHILKVPGGSDLLSSGTSCLVEATKAATPGPLRHWDCANMFAMSYWREKENREGFVRFLAAELNVKTALGWRAVTRGTFHRYGGKILLDYVVKDTGEKMAAKDAEIKAIESTGAKRGTLVVRGHQPSPEYTLLKECLPEMITVEPECRGRMESSYWKDPVNTKAFLDRLAEIHGVSTAQDWAKVGVKEVIALGGHGMLRKFGGMLEALQFAYPETVFDIHTCRAQVSQGFWSQRRNRRAFMDEVARKMGVKKPKDWKNVLGRHIRELGGGGLLEVFSGGVFAILKDAYPEQDMAEAEVRQSVPKGHWKKKENRQKFLKELAEALDIKTEKDWQRVTAAQVKEMGGTGLLYRYKDSVYALLEDTLEDLTHDVCRPRVTSSHWDSKEACIRFLDRVKTEHQIKNVGDWARVTNDDIRRAGGHGLVVKYGSLFKALHEVYREHLGAEDCTVLAPILRPTVKMAFWEDPSNVASFTRYLEGALQIKEPADWFRVSAAEMTACRAGSMLRAISLLSALEITFPDVKWEELQSNAPKKSTQRLLRQAIFEIFGNTNSIMNSAMPLESTTA